MSGDSGSDMAANAWPGFVDILSAVVIMFVFFVLITAAVLYFYTITYTGVDDGKDKEVIEEVAEPQVASAMEKLEELEQENKELREQLESTQSEAAISGGDFEVESDKKDLSTQAFGEQASEQAVSESDGDNSMVIFHDAGAITVDDDVESKIGVFVNKMIGEAGADNIEILLTSPKAADALTQSRAQRLAVARMLNVRNALLKSSANRKNISLKVVESESIDDSADWTRLQINIRQ